MTHLKLVILVVLIPIGLMVSETRDLDRKPHRHAGGPAANY